MSERCIGDQSSLQIIDHYLYYLQLYDLEQQTEDQDANALLSTNLSLGLCGRMVCPLLLPSVHHFENVTRRVLPCQ